jgi:hypothetical protein
VAFMADMLPCSRHHDSSCLRLHAISHRLPPCQMGATYPGLDRRLFQSWSSCTAKSTT